MPQVLSAIEFNKVPRLLETPSNKGLKPLAMPVVLLATLPQKQETLLGTPQVVPLEIFIPKVNRVTNSSSLWIESQISRSSFKGLVTKIQMSTKHSPT
jgi:hypothetical protein